MKGIIYYFLLFIIISFFSYLFAVFSTRIINKKWVNKGFLMGPIMPMYGFISLIIIYLLKGYYNDVIVVIVFSIIIGLIIKYITSILLEKLFSQKFWNYDIKYNLNGRINPFDALIFGTFGIFVIYLIEPFIIYLFQFINLNYLKWASLIILILLITDIILSYLEARRICRISSHLEVILNEYTKSRNIKLNKIKLRLYKAYPYLLNNQRLYQRLEKLKKDFLHFKKLVK